MNSLTTPQAASPARRASASTMTKQHQPPKAKFKKAPQAPRRFKSAYMFYSTWKHKDIREQLSMQQKKIQTPEVAKMVSRSWKKLTALERAPWDEMARKDKARFQLEKSLYDGPWKVPDVKDPHAPKRPVSAFLLYSKAKRDLVKRDGRHRTTTEISTVLSKMWKEASLEERQLYIQRDLEDRQRYKRELYEYQLVASDGRDEREARAARAVQDEEDDHRITTPLSPLSSCRHAKTCMDEDDEERDDELSRLVETDPIDKECAPPPPPPSRLEAHRSEVSSPGMGFAAEWGRGDDAATPLPLDDAHPPPSQPQLGTYSVGPGMELFRSNDCPPEHSPQLQEDPTTEERRDETMGDRLLADLTESMDDLAGGKCQQPYLPLVNTMNWEPIPWDAPVAEFDHLSSSDCGADLYGDDDYDDDFDVSPIATRATMDDGSLAPVITPPRLSMTPKLFMDATTTGRGFPHRLPPLGYPHPFYQQHHQHYQQHQQHSWKDHRQYYNSNIPALYRNGYGGQQHDNRNDAPAAAVPPPSSHDPMYHRYSSSNNNNNNIDHARYLHPSTTGRTYHHHGGVASMRNSNNNNHHSRRWPTMTVTASVVDAGSESRNDSDNNGELPRDNGDRRQEPLGDNDYSCDSIYPI